MASTGTLIIPVDYGMLGSETAFGGLWNDSSQKSLLVRSKDDIALGVLYEEIGR